MSKQRDVASYLIGLIENGDRLIVNDHQYHADVVVRMIEKRIPGMYLMEYVWNIESFASDPSGKHVAIRRMYDVDGSGLIRTHFFKGDAVSPGKILVTPTVAYEDGYGYV